MNLFALYWYWFFALATYIFFAFIIAKHHKVVEDVADGQYMSLAGGMVAALFLSVLFACIWPVALLIAIPLYIGLKRAGREEE